MIAIIDYRAGNLRSVERAIGHLSLECKVTDNIEEIVSARRVIFPGVGAAGKAMDTISELGLDRAMAKVIEQGKPFMGICLGTQIIFDRSEEDDTACLGFIPGVVRKFQSHNLKIPHMGWNSISVKHDHPILESVDRQAQFYFVHSFYPDPLVQEDVIATTDYGIEFAAITARNNVVATQFHPEKSGRAGLKILENFCKWDGKL